MAAKFNPHADSAESVLKKLETKKNGLSEKEVLKRQKRYGPNIFEEEKEWRFFKILLAQIKSPLVLILIFGGFISLFLKEFTDSTVIFIAVLVNTVIGMLQEGKASRAFEKLKSSQKKFALVIRDEQERRIESSGLVPGDIIVLEAGDQVPADARIFEQKDLEINESALTGEWIAVGKNTAALPPETALIEKTNMAWMGTLLTEGWAKAVVVNIGLKTEFGKIAELVRAESETKTPLQKGIQRLAWMIGGIVLGILVLIFALGIARGIGLGDMFLLAVIIAVAAVPEGLPVAVTVILALGMERILRRGGLVRKLPAVETLGSTSVILTDKTGTLTRARMRVSGIFSACDIKDKDNKVCKDKAQHSIEILRMAFLASRAFIENPKEELKKWIVRGRPIDSALVLAGIEAGLKVELLAKETPEIDFLPFDSERRFAASLRQTLPAKTQTSPGKNKVFIAGASEIILGMCSKFLKEGKVINLTKEHLAELEKLHRDKTSGGTRMIGIAFREGEWEKLPRDHDHVFESFVFAGFVGFHDPLREDVKQSIKAAKKAGVRVIMVTGDHPATARAIAQEAGLIGEKGKMVEGKDIEKLSDKDLEEMVKDIDIFARTLPHQKTAILKAWQARGEIVAMTGDGINDAPALRAADIGVALGSGTEVAKEASELVLVNNSFSIIVRAIEEGRVLLDNLRKVITYLLATGFTEVVLVAGALLGGFVLPILPAQILWANLIQGGLMNFAFAFEPKEKGVMKRNPSIASSKKIITKEMLFLILAIGIITDLFLLGLFFILRHLEFPLAEIRTIMFAGVSMDAIFFAFSLKSLRKPIWKINIFSNRYLLAAWSISVVLLLAAIFTPFLQNLLKLVPLSFNEFMIILGLGTLNLFMIELAKWKFNKKSK